MDTEQAILFLRQDPRYTRLIYDAYLEEDLAQSGERFLHSAEFAEVREMIGRSGDGTILDLGAGTGIASYAFARSGAKRVLALEPDLSAVTGGNAVRLLTEAMPVEVIAAFGEQIPLRCSSVDAIYARQVLHHTQDLAQVLKECARVLRSGGVFLACREHVVDDQEQLQAFLRDHPIHQLTGGENAYSLEAYLNAVESSGLRLKRLLGPWESVINAFPGVKTAEELERYPSLLLSHYAGVIGGWLGSLAPVRQLIWKRLNRPVPGRSYTFWAIKP